MKMKRLLLTLLVIALALPSVAQLNSGNAATNYAKFKKFFNDDICTELALPYSAMTDEQLREQMSDIAKELVDVAIKVKNNAWEKNEKEFRVAKFKPQTDPAEWDNKLDVYTYSLMPCPAGIIGNKENIMIFVGGEVPSGVSLGVYKVASNDGHGFLYNSLKAGLNVISMPEDKEAKMLFIEYYAYTDTTETSRKLADFPEMSMHFEGGHVNGYFDVTKHDDAYWRELLAAHKADSVACSYPAIQVLGEKVMFHMTRNELAAVCPNTITDAINWWDDLVKFEHKLMGVDKYYDRWNDRIMARNGVGSYMFATQGYTYYENNTLAEILPWSAVYSSPGRIWGPAHEIGHVNQGAINIVSCTEASNNLFSNAMIHSVGKSTTRGDGVSFCVNEFLKKTPFPLRKDNPIGVSRMFYQLYLYFHAVGIDKTFYPRLFEALRKDPMQKGDFVNNIYQTYAKDNQLKFAEKCCEIAQMDLSEFFEVWGFFEPMDNAFVGDYSNYNVNLTKEEAEASRARMQQYPKKGGHLMFIEDRIKPSKREDGVEGYRIDFSDEYAIGKMGDVGQWGDYIDESVKAHDYYYAVSYDVVKITTDDNSGGALGFKLYDAKTGKLLSFSNTYQIKIPIWARNREYRVVAAQADGTDYELPNIIEFDNEELQKEALSALLEALLPYTIFMTETGDEIGYYFYDAVEKLCDLYSKAEKAVKKNDTSKHSYKEWYELLSAEKKEIDDNPNALARINEYEAYKIENVDGFKILCNNVMGVKGVDKITDKKAANWLMVSAGKENCYYLRDMNGNYLNDFTSSGSYCSGKSMSEAVEFEVMYNSDCSLSFVTKNGLYLAFNDEDMAVGTTTMNTNATWLVTRMEKVSTAIEEIVTEENNGEFYDLQGRKIQNPGKGVYIKNGKKMIIK